MTSSNPPSRSPSRAMDSPRQSSTPGVLAISSAMLANANQSQSGQSTTPSSKRSKSVNQRRAQNASTTSLFDPQSPVPSPRASKEDSQPQPGSALTAALAQDSPTAAASPADSPSKRTRVRRRAKAPQSASDPDEGGELVGGQPVDASSAPAAKASRPRQGRGTSAVNMALKFSAQADLDDTSNSPREALDPSQLSRSAPASSFLDNVQQSRKRNDKQTPNTSNNFQKEDNQQTNHLTPRGSNSADEWEMPSARTGNDSLTWQQQAALSSKSSQGKKSNNINKTINDNKQYKKQAVAPVQRVTPLGVTSPAPRSGLSNAMSVAASNEPAPTPSSLTWQQEQLQRSSPATPSANNLFEALEDGYSGARPATDHSRTRSSPVKNSRPFTRSQQQNASLKSASADKEEVDLDKLLNDLILSSTKPDKPAQSKSAKKTKLIPINASTVDELKAAELNKSARMQSMFDAAPSISKPIPMSAGSVSPSKSALYAGPKFHNSPHAGQLPTPRLAAFMNRNRDSSPATPSPPNAGAIFA